MKEYKPTYCISLLYFWALLFAALLPLLVLSFVVMVITGQTVFWTYALEGIGIGGLMLVVSVLLVFLASLIMGPFAKNTVEVSEHNICYEGKTIQLDRIRYITVRLPVFSRHFHESQVLEITTDDEICMDIKRPSVALIAVLKKRCAFARFAVDDWKTRLLHFGAMELAIVAITLVSYFQNNN